MTSMKNMRSYLQKVVADRATSKGPEDSTDNEGGIVKQAKKVIQKSLAGYSSSPISAPPLPKSVDKSEDAVKSHGAKKISTRRQRPASPESSNPSASKKLKTSEECAKKQKSAEEGFVTWSDTITEFVGEGRVKSLWDNRFPVSTFIADNLWYRDDFDKVAAVGPDQAAIAMQSYGLKIAALGRMFADEMATLREQERTARTALKDEKKKLAEYPNLVKENSELKAEVERLRNPDLIKENVELKAEVQRLTQTMEEAEVVHRMRNDLLRKTFDETIAEWNEKMKQIQTELDGKNQTISLKDQEIDSLNYQSAGFMVSGFDRAKEQVKFLYPDLDLSELDVLKVVLNGELVEEPEETEASQE